MTDNNSSDAKEIVPITRARSRGRPFTKGNKLGGRPKGLRNKATRLVEHLIEGESEEIIRSVIAAAKRGNSAAITAVMNILSPPRRGRSVAIDIGGDVEQSAASLARVTTAVLKAAVDGIIPRARRRNSES